VASINDLTTQDVSEFLRLDEDDSLMLTPIMSAAKAYIMDYTGMAEEDLDNHEDLFIAFMVLCQDMYDNRAMYVDKDNVNKVVDSVLFRHRTNFL
jgi:hypothetical protein